MLIILDNKNRFLQRKHRFDSLDLQRTFGGIKQNIKYTNYFSIANFGIGEEELILFTSSQNENYKKYIEYVLYFHKDLKLIPSYEVLLAHENKLFQELYNKKYKINTRIKTYVIGDLDDYYQLKKQNLIPKKFVIKGYNGSASTNVRICNSFDEGENFLQDLYKPVREAYNKMAPQKYNLYQEENSSKVMAIIQEFVKSSKCEWRILVSGEKYFGFKRLKENEDTLASGGLEKYGADLSCEIPVEILDYSREIFEKIDSPFVILDIIEDEEKNELSLIEWSGIHIGIVYGKNIYRKYYKFDGTSYKKFFFSGEISDTFSDSINWYINKKWQDI